LLMSVLIFIALVLSCFFNWFSSIIIFFLQLVFNVCCGEKKNRSLVSRFLASELDLGVSLK
jgi:hypothetical protein